MFLHAILRRECAILVLVWTTILEAVLPATVMLTVIGKLWLYVSESSVVTFS